ncbi:MAG: ABC transporter ATP-binding protein [bacterium]
MTDAIRTDGLVKRYRRFSRTGRRVEHTAVAGLDFSVPVGGITGLLGPNGAGKTTAVRMLLGLVRPTSGTATVLGHDAQRESLAIRARTAFVPAERAIFGWMRAEQFVAGVARWSASWDAERAARLMGRWRIDGRARMRELSSGTQSRLVLLVALARGASLLVLDEPTTGLDPEAVDDALSELAIAAADGATVLLVTHRLEEVERICDRVVVMNEGRALIQADLDDLRAGWRAIEVAEHPVLERVSTWEEVAYVSRYGEGHARLLVRSSPDAVRARLRMLGADVTSERPLTLREIYLAITRADGDAARDDLA